MKTFLSTITDYLNRDFMTMQPEVRFVTYTDLLKDRKERVKRLMLEASKERNFAQFYRAKNLLQKIENTTFTITSN